MSLDTLRVDLRSKRSDYAIWNKIAAEIFAQGFVDTNDYECKDTELIASAFLTYTRTLKEHYIRHQTGGTSERYTSRQKRVD